VTTLPSTSPMPWTARASAEVGHQGDAMLIGGHAVAATGMHDGGCGIGIGGGSRRVV
jgi:hypothetical protein